MESVIYSTKKIQQLTKQKKMQKRLISENLIPCNNQSCPEFSAFGSFVAYKTDSAIRIKTCNKEIKEVQISLQMNLCRWYFCSYQARLLIVLEYTEGYIEIYEIDIASNHIKNTFVQKLNNSKCSVPLKQGIAYIFEEKVVKMLNFEKKTSNTVCQCAPNSSIIQHEGQDIFVLSPSQNPDVKILRIFTKTEVNYEESPLNIDYIKSPLAIFRDQYVFQQQKQNKDIQIFNITLSKMVGKFNYEGELVKVIQKGSLLLVITNRQNMDRYYFYTLNNDPNSKSILSHRSVYEKGKGAYFQAFSCAQEVGEQISLGKITQISKQIQQPKPTANQVLLIYMQPVKKNKIQIMRVSNAKIKDQAFKQHELDKIILCKTQMKQKGISHKKSKAQTQSLQIEKARVNSSMNHRKSEKSVEELQRALINHIVDIKIKGILQKFEQLEKKLNSIEGQIALIYNKIDKSIENINRQQVKRNVENLFDRVTPQFESYFKEVFRQISGVMDQGLNYYSNKLVKESEVHREAFNQVINMTFDAAQEITQLGRKQLQHSEKTSENIQKLLQIRKKWEAQVLQFSQPFKIPKNTLNPNNHELTLKNPTILSPDKKSSPQIKKKN